MEWFTKAAAYFGDGMTILAGISMLAGAAAAGAKIWGGIKCILRSEMLRIYYAYKDQGKIRQYELENFLMMYKAYRAMHGNSFIEVIHREVTSWETIA